MFNTLTRMGASGAATSYSIDKSLRFNAFDDAYISYKPSTTGNQKVWTWSGWVKRTEIGVYTHLLTCDMHSGEHNNGIAQLAFDSSDKLYTYFDTSGSNPYGAVNDAVFRDVASWYHIVWQVDAANTDQRIWVNGVELACNSGQDPPDYDYAMNKADHLMAMGASAWDGVTGHSDLLLAEVHYIDGTKYQASDFGETNEDTGQWVPKEVDGITYGTNGCYLPFTGDALKNSFTDSSGDARTVTPVGEAHHSTAQKKIGSSSIYFDGSFDAIGVPDHSDFDFGTGDFTIECWVRRSRQDADEWFFMHSDGTGAGSAAGLHIWSTQYGGSNANKAHFRLRMGGSSIDCNGTTTLATNTWYHIAGVRDGNTARIYVDGVQEASVSISGSLDTSDAAFAIGAIRASGVGAGSDGLQGYIDEPRLSNNCRYPNGTTFTPSTTAFSSDANTLILVHSDFSGTDLAADSSGTGNDWTAHNMSVTAGVGNDSFNDTPSNNWCTLSDVDSNSGIDVKQGGLQVYTSAGFDLIKSTFYLRSGKWYWEVTCDDCGNGFVGVSNWYDSYSNRGGDSNDSCTISTSNGDKRVNGSTSSYGSAISDGDVMMFALDMDNGKFWAGKSGTWFDSGNPATGSNPATSSLAGDEITPSISLYDNEDYTVNFGANMDFAHTPPTGFKAINMKNYPVPTIKNSKDYFNTILYTATGVTNRTLTGVGFSPNLGWFARRNASGAGSMLFDTVRGATYELYAPYTNGHDAVAESVKSFDSDGYTLGNNWPNAPGTGSDSWVNWNWKESATAGFDIVSYTGNGTGGRTIAHGLGVKPDVMLVKKLSGSEDWILYCGDLVGTAGGWMKLNESDTSVSGNSTGFDGTDPTSSVFTVGSHSRTNENNATYINYLWSSVSGFSKFGQYIGNQDADGPYVWCGFKPQLIILKHTDRDSNWGMYDVRRNHFNPNTYLLHPNNNNSENTSGSAFDIYSNGFKVRNDSLGFNESGDSIFFMAFAENPFNYANAH